MSSVVIKGLFAFNEVPEALFFYHIFSVFSPCGTTSLENYCLKHDLKKEEKQISKLSQISMLKEAFT